MRIIAIAFSLLCVGACAYAQSLPGEIRLSDETLRVLAGDAPVFTYRYANVPMKPYVSAWNTLADRNILRDAPHDHLHHHGLMLAIKVNDVNFWEETPGCGVQAHQRFMDVIALNEKTGFTEELFWHAGDASDVMLVEQRTVHHLNAFDGKARVLDWRSELRVPEGKEQATLGGNSYHGLGMRFPEDMDKVGKFLFAGDETGGFNEGPHYLAQAAWCAYTVESDGKAATVAMFSAVENPRPTLWFTMREPFSYLSATQNLFREPLTVTAEAPVVLHYGVAVWDTVVSAEEIAALCNAWRDGVK